MPPPLVHVRWRDLRICSVTCRFSVAKSHVIQHDDACLSAVEKEAHLCQARGVKGGVGGDEIRQWELEVLQHGLPGSL